jgi:anaphase-promoting complex subunit 2
MDWAPDPIDAGPDYQRTKVEDIFGHLFKLFDRDSFIDVLKTILCKHLLSLKDNPDFAKEIKVLELFKLRLGEDNLQPCEVMLNDVVSSGRINQSVHRSEVYKANSDPEKDTPEANCTILSSYFWPPLKELPIKLPQAMTEIQDRYQRGYQSNKGSQGPGKQAGAVSALLEFNNALGTVEIELEIENQVFCEKVSPLFAAVIYAFGEDLRGGRKSCAAIASEIKVGEAEVMNALDFWMSKGIIRPAPPSPDGVTYFEVGILHPVPGTYITDEAEQVVEAMSTENDAEASAASTTTTQEQNAMLNSPNAQLYANYITTMLTSNGNMPVARIAQMLKMTMTGGFSYSNDVLVEFLDSMVKEGLLRTKNGVYGVPKKK